jgi:amino acid efflux transporter
MAPTHTTQTAAAQHLTTSRGAALYIGAIFGPGLLVLPGLAAAEAGPASIIAWLGLLGLSGVFAAVFSALGRNVPSSAGVMGYVTDGLGSRAGRATGWIFLAGVVSGAPIVCLAGASYVTNLTGGGQLITASVAGALLLTVLGLAARGLRATAAAQLALVSVLTVVVIVAVAGSAATARAGNWVPFAPHGWLSVGSAATTLMFSFVGWEAVAPLTTRFADPSRQLPRAVAIAVAVTTALYLSLAAVTIGVLGPRAATDAPLARLLSYAIGKSGPYAAAAAAIVLTLGATNAYISGAAATAGQLVRSASASGRPAPKLWLLAAIAAAGLALISSYGLGIIGIAGLVAVPTALFLTVYLGAMIAAARMLRGRVRLAALPAAVAVTVMLAFCGRALVIPAAVALAASWRAKSGSGRTAIRVLSFGARRHRSNRLRIETADAQQLMDIPFDHLVRPLTAGNERLLSAQRIEIGPGHVPEHDDPKVAVVARAGDQHLAGELLLPHPCKVIVAAALDRLLAIANPSVQGQVPQFRPPAIASGSLTQRRRRVAGATAIHRMRRWSRQ